MGLRCLFSLEGGCMSGWEVFVGIWELLYMGKHPYFKLGKLFGGYVVYVGVGMRHPLGAIFGVHFLFSG